MAKIPTRALKQLRALDEKLTRATSSGEPGETVFDWSLKDHLRAKSYVGVVQVPGLSIEILPKTDVDWDANLSFKTKEDQSRAQRNLLYMLSVAGRVPAKQRDLASLHARHAPLLEVLIRIFASELLDELRRGADHAYVRREENANVVRGRILFSEHVKRNVAHAERVFVERDEFESDTPLNRVLKCACRHLVHITRSAWTARCLHEALVHLGDVTDTEVREHEIDAVTLHRNNARYETVFEFACMVLRERALAPELGGSQTFSLLFPMESVFEEFIGKFIKRDAAHFGFDPSDVHIQARGHRKWLVRSEHDGAGHFRLMPDILIGTVEKPLLILDTKWKRLVPDARDKKNGVSQSDIYQLFAYAERYRCPDSVLLFPRVEGATPKRYRVDDHFSARVIRVELVDLGRDLQTERAALRDELKGCLGSLLSHRDSSSAP